MSIESFAISSSKFSNPKMAIYACDKHFKSKENLIITLSLEHIRTQMKIFLLHSSSWRPSLKFQMLQWNPWRLWTLNDRFRSQDHKPRCWRQRTISMKHIKVYLKCLTSPYHKKCLRSSIKRWWSCKKTHETSNQHKASFLKSIIQPQALTRSIRMLPAMRIRANPRWLESQRISLK